MIQTLRNQLDILSGKKARAERKKKKGTRANWLRNKEAKNMATTTT